MRYWPLLLTLVISACGPSSHNPAEMPGTRDRRELSGLLAHPERVDYAAVKKFVFTETCLNCHSLNGATPDRDAIAYSANMTDYKSLFNAFTPVVVKGNPEDSNIYRAIAIKQTMPPAKRGFHPLQEQQVTLLRLWIKNCAIEDEALLANELLVQTEDREKVRDCGP